MRQFLGASVTSTDAATHGSVPPEMATTSTVEFSQLSHRLWDFSAALHLSQSLWDNFEAALVGQIESAHTKHVGARKTAHAGGRFLDIIGQTFDHSSPPAGLILPRRDLPADVQVKLDQFPVYGEHGLGLGLPHAPP
jgi:hypothetical protein